MFPEFTACSEFPRADHPGTVTFIGPDGEERVEQAAHLPDWLKFAPGQDGTPVPVVKVVRLAGDRAAGLRSYGADGQLLWVGLSVSPAPQTSTRVDTPAPRRKPVNRLAHLRPAKPASQHTGWF
jgi:hypothetical protein